MTRREAAIVTAFTGFVVGDLGDAHAYIEEVMGRPVWTHEMASREFFKKVREASRADFVQLSENITQGWWTP